MSIKRALRFGGAASFALAALVASPGTAVFAHARPQTMNPIPNARLDNAPAHIVINYDDPIVANQSSLVLLDSSGAPQPTNVDPVSGNAVASISPTSDLAPGPYTVDWTTMDAKDGHQAQGFFAFVISGGPVGIINGSAQKQAPAADLMASLTVTAAPDGSSMLRVDLNNTSGVERIRIDLSRPDLGDDLLDTKPSGDGGWVLNNDEVSVPGSWHAQAIVRRTNIFDDAKAEFDFTVDPQTGEPTFS
ncbi:MAG: copper resistance protein CopC [Chloroflexi bacterium]|nr:copper resistance protein CopC [Chloroflexota bacterium]